MTKALKVKDGNYQLCCCTTQAFVDSFAVEEFQA
jgi:hypothetical protein